MAMYLSGTGLRQIFSFLLGGFDGTSWARLAVAAPLIIGGSMLILLRARALNGFLLGEEAAAHLGVDVKRERVILISLASLVTAAGVAIAGLIGFVGLVVPHFVRHARRPQRPPGPADLGAVRRQPAGRGRRGRADARWRARGRGHGDHRGAVLPRAASTRPHGVRAVRAPALFADGVTVEARERAILRDVSFSLEHGERVALIGPNGAGKSTLLRVLAGILQPAAGRVLLDDVPIASLDRSLVAKRLAVVPQQTALPFSMRVEEVVALGRLPHEAAAAGRGPADRAAVAAAIDRVGLGHLMGRDARELSLGERQLVLLALAVAQAAPVLLLDEPTVHLDLRHQVEAMELLRDLNERDGTALVAVLHDLGLAAHFFPRLVIVEHGRVIADGPPAEVLTDDRIRETFGVEPALVRLAAGVNGG